MGEVWSAHHADGAAVAVKLLRADLAGHPRLLERFASEVRTVAALDHPNVVRILDAGVVPPEAERATGGRLRAGGPWLAMELAEHGSLTDAVVDGPLLLAVAEALLSALAHAHARGILHRDVKPDNVLRAGSDGSRLVLSDFGLAAVDDGKRVRHVEGTRDFMAPEQLRPGSAPLGPWTDLYLVGRTLSALMAGSTTPGAPARFPVPDGFVTWLGRLLAPDPEDRFRHAADAAWALGALGSAGPGRAAPIGAPPATTASWLLAPTLVHLLPHDDDPDVDLAAPPPEAEDVPAADAEDRPPPFPASPELVGGDVGPDPLFDAGMGLWGVREPRFVSRSAEAAALWQVVRSVAEDGVDRVVVLTGPAGVGKSRLGRAVLERAHEVGALSALVRPGASPEHVVPVGRRPIGVWLDGPDALRAARLPSARGARVVVCSVADEDLAADEGLRADLHALRAAGATELALGPLGAADLASLVRGILPLDPALVGAIVDRADGLPSLAARAVDRLVRAGHLRPGPRGLDASAAVEVEPTPEETRRVEQAVGGGDEALLAAVLGPEVEEAAWVTACAAAGRSPDTGALERLCEARLARRHPASTPGWRLGPSAREVLVRRAAREGALATLHAACLAARPEPELPRARHLAGVGRWSEAADLLAELGARGSTGGGDLERPLHLFREAATAMDAAGLPGSDLRRGKLAFAELAAVARWTPQVALGQARRLFADAERFDWPLAGPAARQCARLCSLVGDPAQALAWSERAVALGRVRGDRKELAMAEVERGFALGKLGRTEESLVVMDRAVTTFGELNLPTYEIWVLLRLADDLRKVRRTDAAERAYLRAKEHCERHGLDAWLGDVENGLGELARLRNQLEAAERHYWAALEVFTQAGSNDRLTALVNLAMVELARGQHGRARDRVQHHLPALERLGRTEILLTGLAVQLAAAAHQGDREGVAVLVDEFARRQARSGVVNDDFASLLDSAAEALDGPLGQRVRALAAKLWAAMT